MVESLRENRKRLDTMQPGALKRKFLVLALVLLMGVPVFLFAVPIVSVTEYSPCPLVAYCRHSTFVESVSFYYFQVGAIYGLCTGSDYHMANAAGGYGCANGQFVSR